MRHEVIVVGGGMTGASMAAALAQAGVDVALVEAAPPAGFSSANEYDLRVSAISPGSQRWLTGVGAWPLIAAQRHCAYSYMEVWEHAAPSAAAVLRFSAAELGIEQLGHIIENTLVLDALWQELEGVTIYSPARVQGLEIQEGYAELLLEDHQVLQAQLVVGADGAQSRIRELAGISTSGLGYGQRGIVANVTTEQPHQSTAWQRFLPTGPLAFLPLADGRCSIVWSAVDALASELLTLDDAAFCARLGEAFELKLGAVTATTARASFPLQHLHAEHYVQSRLALIGDAAHVVHPLAGQGVNLGFQDAEVLCSELVVAKEKGRDLGGLPALRRYERVRKAENALMISMTDGLQHLFATSNPLIGMGRRIGLDVVNRLGPLKRQFARHAAGGADAVGGV